MKVRLLQHFFTAGGHSIPLATPVPDDLEKAYQAFQTLMGAAWVLREVPLRPNFANWFNRAETVVYPDNAKEFYQEYCNAAGVDPAVMPFEHFDQVCVAFFGEKGCGYCGATDGFNEEYDGWPRCNCCQGC